MSASELHINLRLGFESAGVAFRLGVEPAGEPAGDRGASFGLQVVELATGREVPFRAEVCPVLADFVKGFSRWLGTKGLRASVGDARITGTFPSNATPQQLLGTAGDICDLISQRFSLYRERILA